jgi:hypothetical protein
MAEMIYNGTASVELDESQGKHQYLVTDTELKLKNAPMRGVTDIKRTIIAKPGLMRWPMDMAIKHIKTVIGKVDCDMPEEVDAMLEQAQRAHTHKSDKGKDIGTEVHAAIERYLKGDVVGSLTNEAVKSFGAFVDWFTNTNAKKVAVEQAVYSRERQYCGKFDAILEIDGKTVLVDFKTTNVSAYALKKGKEWTGLYPEDFMQLGFYSKAYKEANIEIDKVNSRGMVTQRAEIRDLQKVEHIQDLMLINCTKEGKLITLSAKEIGWDVEKCENLAMNALSIADGLKDIKKGALDMEIYK